MSTLPPNDDASSPVRHGVALLASGGERRDAEATRQLLEHLAYGISHDLRAALRSIEGFAGQLEAQALDAQGQAHLARIHAAAASAGTLVEGLVKLTRAGSAVYASEQVDLSLLATWVAAERQDADPGRSVRVFVQPGMMIRGDERQLKLMLEQLLHNAWKFTGGNAQAEIDVTGNVRDDGTFELCVRDNGRGFDAQYADKLFLPFRRLHGPEDGGGHGLGLAIAHAVASRHGGSLRASTHAGAGSRFYVELPAEDARNEA